MISDNRWINYISQVKHRTHLVPLDLFLTSDSPGLNLSSQLSYDRITTRRIHNPSWSFGSVGPICHSARPLISNNQLRKLKSPKLSQKCNQNPFFFLLFSPRIRGKGYVKNKSTIPGSSARARSASTSSSLYPPLASPSPGLLPDKYTTDNPAINSKRARKLNKPKRINLSRIVIRNCKPWRENLPLPFNQ